MISAVSAASLDGCASDCALSSMAIAANNGRYLLRGGGIHATITNPQPKPCLQTGCGVRSSEAALDQEVEVGMFPKRKLISSVCLLALASAGGMTASPSSAAPHHTSQTGSITGVFEEVGGPPPGSPRPLSGIVELTSATGKHVFIGTGKDGSIKAHVAVGTYKVTGRSPKIEGNIMETVCTSPVPVVVRAGHRTHFTVACNVP